MQSDQKHSSRKPYIFGTVLHGYRNKASGTKSKCCRHTRTNAKRRRAWIPQKVTGNPSTTVTGPWTGTLPEDPAINSYTDLSRTFRAGAIVQLLTMSGRFPKLKLAMMLSESNLSNAGANTFLSFFAAKECHCFAFWLQQNEAYLNTLIEHDLALMASNENNKTRVIPFEYTPMRPLQVLGHDHLPEHFQRYQFELVLLGSEA